jgi:phosphoribosylamine--glycine ligase
MNILLIGSGGREHALAWKLVQSPHCDRLYCTPGNPGIAALPRTECIPAPVLDFAAHRGIITEKNIALVVVGPEDPLAAGIADDLKQTGVQVFGPCAAAARLEASKSFAKAFMARHHIPTAAYAEFSNADTAMNYIREKGAPVVVKADGLAAGKGVTVAMDEASALQAVRAMMLDRAFGDAGGRVVIEEFMTGEEASILAFSDGKTVVPLPAAQDHKRVFDNDEGPNTGGMGAYAPAPLVTPELSAQIQRDILEPCIRGMAEEGSPYIGILYAGLMITPEGPKVVEFNCRFGDPETQAVLPLLQSDLVETMLACCHGRLSKSHVVCRPGACVTVVMASPGYPGAYPKGLEITGVEAAASIEGVYVFHAGTAFKDHTLRSNGGRVLAVSATGDAFEDCLTRAYDAVARIHFEGAHFRRDIGARALKRLRATP